MISEKINKMNQNKFVKYLIEEEGRFEPYCFAEHVIMSWIRGEDDNNINGTYAQDIIKNAYELFKDEKWADEIKQYIVFVSDDELEHLNYAYEDGELPLCECLEILINKYIAEKDDCENNIEQSTIDAMFSLNRSAQINDWGGATYDLYRETQKYLLDNIGLEFANGRIERKQ